jgi:hypothetical protein
MAQTTQKTLVTWQTASSLVRYQHWTWRGQHRKHSLIYCCVLDRVYRAVAWQRVDQIRYSIFLLINISFCRASTVRIQGQRHLTNIVCHTRPPALALIEQSAIAAAGTRTRSSKSACGLYHVYRVLYHELFIEGTIVTDLAAVDISQVNLSHFPLLNCLPVPSITPGTLLRWNSARVDVSQQCNGVINKLTHQPSRNETGLWVNNVFRESIRLHSSK